jgi:competence ComEA-like helix-hairpin-helix protein
LGLTEKTGKTIINYVSKGGKFRNPDDLARIYGLRKEVFEKLRPHVRIVDTDPPNRVYTQKQALPAPGKERTSYVDINRADSSDWIALPGIGSKLSARIILFREKLGGFHSVSQVGETFGLPDSVFQKILPYLRQGEMVVKKLNINTATLEELSAHPYIRKFTANAIIAYRNEHGPFKQPDELKKIMLIKEEDYRKMYPYLETTRN